MTAADANASVVDVNSRLDGVNFAYQLSGSSANVGRSSTRVNTSQTAMLTGQQNQKIPGMLCVRTRSDSPGRKYAKSGDMLPIINAASGKTPRLNLRSGRTAAAWEIVNGTRVQLCRQWQIYRSTVWISSVISTFLPSMRCGLDG